MYARVINGVVDLYPTSIPHLFNQGIVQSLNPTQTELDAANIVKVEQVTGKPPHNEFNYDVNLIQKPNGAWVEEWVQIETSEQEKQNRINLHSQHMIDARNRLLQLCDWTQLPDAPIANKQEWAAYRQALRDVPAQAGFPFEINWPALP